MDPAMKAIGELEFFERWKQQHNEWLEIAAERAADVDDPLSAWDVSQEQRKRALRDGRTLVLATPDGFYEITSAEDLAVAEAANA